MREQGTGNETSRALPSTNAGSDAGVLLPPFLSFPLSPSLFSASMKSICVYCGSNPGAKPVYVERATELGRRIAAEGLRLVYGGGRTGLMGAVADGVLAAGGEVTGVIPQHLVDLEVAHKGVTTLEIVGSMHERKSRMFDLSDAFVALPGGFGTAEEIFEMLTWRQLGIGKKPCAFLDIDGFYAQLIGMIDHMVAERFLHPEQRDDLWHGEDPTRMLEWMRAYSPAQADKWFDEKKRNALR